MILNITIEETKRGDVEIKIDSMGAKTATRKEHCYAQNIVDLLKLELPKLSKMLGATAAIDMNKRA